MARIEFDNYTQTLNEKWAGDNFDPQYLIRGGAKLDPTQFAVPDAVTAVVGAAGAIATATSVPVAALAGPIPNGTLLDFTGSGKFAKLTAAAAAGATSLTVEALPEALVSGNAATYAGVLTRKIVPSGTIVGRTRAERAANTGFGPAGDADEEFAIVAFTAYDIAVNDDVTLVRPFSGFTVKENYLPGFASLSATVLAALRARYFTTIGRD